MYYNDILPSEQMQCELMLWL